MMTPYFSPDILYVACKLTLIIWLVFAGGFVGWAAATCLAAKALTIFYAEKEALYCLLRATEHISDQIIEEINNRADLLPQWV